MAFVKLDTGILDSTLWLDRDLREVFITALLMAQPCEFSEFHQQMEVDSLNTTDFSVPPGWYGFVKAAGMGIINRAGVPRAEGMDALRKLGAPEAESRSENFDGRRMVRVNGGYVILNFMRYRDKDHTGAVRAKNLRLRKKLGIDALLKEQDYKCDCCESQFTEPYRDSVIQDHHHASGENRGLICPSCNVIVGLIESKKKTQSPKKQICLDYISRYAVTSQENGVSFASVTHTEDRGQRTEAEKEKLSSSEQQKILYKAYPRHTAPDAAYKAIEKVLRKKTFDELLPIVQAYAIQTAKRISDGKLEKEFIPHPSTWFNQGRYEDDDLKPAAQFEIVEVSPEEWWGKK